MFPLKFCSWIPNNNAYLDKNKIPSESCGFIEKSRKNNTIELILPPTYDYTDSVTDIESQLPLSASFRVVFYEHLWKFDMEVRYVGEAVGSAMIKGIIYLSGLLKFEIVDMTNLGYTQNFPNLIFTLIKRIVHEDNHHNVKIDTLIPVIEERKFRYEMISYHLADRIKDIEYQVKLLKKNKNSFKEFKEFETMLLKAKGIFAYYQAYSEIFNVKIQRTPQYVIQSLELILDEFKSKIETVKYKYATVVSLVALLISGNILIKTENDWPLEYPVKEHFLSIEIIFVFLLAFLFLLMHHKLKGNVIDRFPLIKEQIINAFIYGKVVNSASENLQHRNFITFVGLHQKKIVVFGIICTFASIIALLVSHAASAVFAIALLFVTVIFIDFYRWKNSK
jgi:hypothetical protein